MRLVKQLISKYCEDIHNDMVVRQSRGETHSLGLDFDMFSKRPIQSNNNSWTDTYLALKLTS